ncbi:sugar phosphate isomerase/epimerase family protein [Aureibacillus halotolerans]|uniref:Sugar phosphate isomerase/epimerase n=1 Tax=Aureibacillus halotolerans TaxID=1508390 RepID=A0A4R6U8A6_9BACI|nr:sugar phosphate isomerase/epimerase family protein [Aureibacillus halotolerans]TDQ41009.1 sugar phosphate isomerase/epimerase [Aureibacillus halotolerans]
MFPFKIALNSSTLFPYELSLHDQIRIASQAGYEGIELWVKDIDLYLEQGGNLAELKAFAEEQRVEIVNAIAFWTWADENPEERAKGLAHAKKEMAILSELGCPAAAAPPFGNVANTSLESIAEAYRNLFEAGQSLGVTPILEFWGRADKLSTLGEAIHVAVASGVPTCPLLLDPFHMYTGGTTVDSLAYLKKEYIGIVHVNDYPSAPHREVIEDKHRVFPGEGVAPSRRFAEHLHAVGYTGYLSLELFFQSPEGSPEELVKRGMDRIRTTYAL